MYNRVQAGAGVYTTQYCQDRDKHTVYVCKVVAGTGMVFLGIKCITCYGMCIPYISSAQEKHVKESAPMHLGSVYPVLCPAPTF